MAGRRAQVLDALGVERFVPRKRAATAANPSPAANAASVTDADDPRSRMDWDGLEREVAACTRCALSTTRTRTVFGVGDRGARWFIVGEAPGAEEDRQGEPFVGRAGQLLNSMLRAVGQPREQVFIANVLKCRPPGNRDPSPEEVRCCLPFLRRQIALVDPDLILCVGRIAAQNLLSTETPIGKLRGTVHALAPFRAPVIVTYHPAYLLRSPGEKQKAWEDLKFAMGVARGDRA